MKKHISITVRGKVQGVFFRASTKAQAELLGITGTVRNLSDGSVYIQAEGSEDALHQFVIWCHDGPRHARVDFVETNDGELQHFASFQIVR